ncbi:MAG: RidA family protein [Bacteroidetes bacterium]|nr:RidA family protein [Bacteroidota bacterium]
MRVICYFIFLSFSFTVFSQNKQVVFTPKAPKPIGPYSQGILTGNTLYVAGQLGIKPDGSLDSTSIETETTLVLENIKAIMEAAKMNLKNVAKATVYMTDLRNFKKMNDIYATYFPENPPARETVEVKALARGAHIEISVIAVR